MKLTRWKRILALLLVAIVSFLAVESATRVHDFGACYETNLCGCVHAVETVLVASVLPFLKFLPVISKGFVSVSDWKSEPPLLPPIA